MKELYHFKGQIVIEDNATSSTLGGKNSVSYLLDLKNFLHRGCMIKHSGKIFAMIIATGKETKIMLN